MAAVAFLAYLPTTFCIDIGHPNQVDTFNRLVFLGVEAPEVANANYSGLNVLHNP